jgi:hypothetical protein
MLATLNSSREMAVRQFVDFMQQASTDQFMDLTVRKSETPAFSF